MVRMVVRREVKELTTAAATGNIGQVRDLLSNGVNVNGVNEFGNTAIQVMMMGNAPLALLLLNNGADPNVSHPKSGCTPLHDAARAGFLDTVQVLIHFNADPNATDHFSFRPIDVARQNKHLRVVHFLSEENT